jgi:hypothetical protein
VDDGRWRLYQGPLEFPEGEKLAAKAVRYGWRESDEVQVDLRTSAAE